jgi:hypothetical protein
MEKIIISILIILIACLFIYIFLFERKITKLEKRIMKEFQARTQWLPALFEITKPYFAKHEEIFNESLHLRKISFQEHWEHLQLLKTLNTEKKIHKELNFLFNVCKKHPKLTKESRYQYLEEHMLQISWKIADDIQLYKKVCAFYNHLLIIKNCTIIGLFLPFSKKETL